MQSQLEQLRIAHAEAMAEVDRRVSESTAEARKEVERVASASRDQERLAMQRLEERVRSMSLELDSARMEAAAAKAAEEEARRELAAGDEPTVEAERRMREMRAEQERMLAQLQGSKEAVAREQQETARLKLASSESEPPHSHPAPTHSLTPTRSLTHSLARSLTHTHSLAHSLAHGAAGARLAGE